MYFVLFFGKGNNQQSFLYIFTWFSKRHRCKHKQFFREVLFFSSVNIYFIFILEDNNPRFINCNNKSFHIPHFPGAAYKCEAYKNEVNKIIKSMIPIYLSLSRTLSHTHFPLTQFRLSISAAIFSSSRIVQIARIKILLFILKIVCSFHRCAFRWKVLSLEKNFQFFTYKIYQITHMRL